MDQVCPKYTYYKIDIKQIMQLEKWFFYLKLMLPVTVSALIISTLAVLKYRTPDLNMTRDIFLIGLARAYDVSSTYIGKEKFGVEEANPIGAKILKTEGYLSAFVRGFIAFSFAAFYIFNHVHKEVYFIFLLSVVGFEVIAGTNNVLQVLLKMPKSLKINQDQIVYKFSILIILGFTIFVISKKPMSDLYTVNFATFLVLSLTLIYLIIYAHKTKEISETTKNDFKERLKPNISVDFIQSKNNSLEIIVRILNHKPIKTKIFIDLDLRLDGKKIEILAGDYSGKKPFFVNPQKSFQGFHNFEDDLKENIASLAQKASGKDWGTFLAFSPEVSFESDIGIKDSLFKEYYYFQFDINKWIPDPTKYKELS